MTDVTEIFNSVRHGALDIKRRPEVSDLVCSASVTKNKNVYMGIVNFV